MSSKQLSGILVGLLVLLGLGLLVAVYGANRMLVTKSDDLANLKAKHAAIQKQEDDLDKVKQDVAQYRDLNGIAKSIVPQDKDQAKTVSEIVKLANDSGISRLSSVAFPPSNLGGGKGDNLTQLTPVKGLSGVYSLPITISQASDQTVPYGSFITFLTKLEHNRRTALISSISITPDAKQPDQVSFTLVINEYIKP